MSSKYKMERVKIIYFPMESKSKKYFLNPGDYHLCGNFDHKLYPNFNMSF